jgi:hypothetical protein
LFRYPSDRAPILILARRAAVGRPLENIEALLMEK